MSEQEETSILEAMPLPKLECYYEAAKNKYWIKDSNRKWSPRIAGDVKIELEKIGYSARAAKGKTYSAADYELSDIRNLNGIVFAGEVAGKQPGLHEGPGIKYLVTAGPKLVDPKKGDWGSIRKLGERLFGAEQLEFVLGWSQSAVKSLYSGNSGLRSQMLVLAGPAGCGKSFWQNHVISGILGGRTANPMQYMSGGTGFNEDIIRAEHLMMEDQHSRTDIRSRRALGAAVKEFTVNRMQRCHGKGKDAMAIDSKHWISLSLNDEAENLSILPPMDESLKDKIALIRCFPAVNREWPGHGKNEWLEQAIRDEIPAFLEYLFVEHEIRTEWKDERFGIVSMHNDELIERLDRLSPEDGLDLIIDKCWEQLSKEGGTLKAPAEDIETRLHNHDELAYRAKRILTWDGACAVFMERLSKKYPDKYVKPRPNERPRTWTIKWK